ncbi:phospholipase D-like domain-containing protein [Arenimonas sp.]|uniref:phospholipase D-like domain-containing protein n=1 Tax=Arenimonas sp. TaxID=1872635 RepID=UPI0039E229A0
MILIHRLALALFALALGACAHLSPQQRLQASEYAERAQATDIECPDSGCELASPLHDLGPQAVAASTEAAPRHAVVLLDRGQDALLARVHLIRSARRSIDLQTFHFDRDDSGTLVLDELMAAAKRGVRVRLLLDQLGGLTDPELQAELAGFHRNFELRVYNPVFDQARVAPLEFFAGIVLKFRDINQRMHNKLMVVDGHSAIIGGRNIQDDYYDWNDKYNYRDRELLIAGPVAAAMVSNFEAFWTDPRSQPASRLGDVAEVLLANQGPPGRPELERSERVLAMEAAAGDASAVFARLSPSLLQVGRVDFFGDLPIKHDDAGKSRDDASRALLELLESTQEELLVQTPYLVMSRPARQMFRRMYRRDDPPLVLVSTNSLAATDAFPVYAMSHKYKRLYLRELGFEIHEFKPFPLTAPIDLAATGAKLDLPQPPPGEPAAKVNYDRNDGPVPLKRAGVRIGLHAKSMVIDERIGVVGSHNFDPRSADYNTESMVVVHDEAFASALAASIRNDMAPENAWTIAPREKLPVVAQLNYNLGKLSEKLPIFDIWPLPYATSFELKPECQPLPPGDPKFYQCYEAVGDFPEVNLSLKSVYTRILTAFGAGLIPIL